MRSLSEMTSNKESIFSKYIETDYIFSKYIDMDYYPMYEARLSVRPFHVIICEQASVFLICASVMF